jgi:hypothetical protein
MSNNVYLTTYTGRKFFPLNPEPHQIDIEDIARGLSKICRFCGQIKDFYSVAEHSIEVMHLVPHELKLAALLHDASEAYISDIPSPLKRQLEDYQKVEGLVEMAIDSKFGISWEDPSYWEIVKWADTFMVKVELLRFHGPEVYNQWFGEPTPDVLAYDRPLGLRHDLAFIVFLRAFNELTNYEQQTK